MKLSEAIRLGAMMKPQAFDDYQHYVYHDGDEGVIGTCALGAAMDAVGALDTFENDSDVFPQIDGNLTNGQCPACGEKRLRLGGMVTHLNDQHRWTREQIADWVATVEQADQPQPQIETPATVTV